MQTSPELLAGLGTLAGAVALVIKKLITCKAPKPKPEYITHAEFHQGMDSVRDRVGAGYMVLADKIASHHNELHAALTRQGEKIEQRLDNLETFLARVDERTRNSL